jgi:hypothetical protein
MANLIKLLRNNSRELLCAILTVLCAIQSAHVNAHNQDAYSSDRERRIYNPKWLSAQLDFKRLSELSIPGTHDSMAYNKPGLLLTNQVRTQGMYLEDQLLSGIRALDIRVSPKDGKLAIHHGSVFLKTYLDNVLDIVAKFLKDNPKEFVVMRISHDHGNAKTSKNRFQNNDYLKNPRWSNLFWRNTNVGNEFRNNPRVGDIRGKIVLLRKGDVVPTNYGVPHPDTDPCLNKYSQDCYLLKGDYGTSIYNKWIQVKSASGWISSYKGPIPPLSINYLSATGVSKIKDLGNGLSPFNAASGHSDQRTNAPRMSTARIVLRGKDDNIFPDFPRLACIKDRCTIYIEGINTLFQQVIGKKGHNRRAGIVMADFPGHALIRDMIGLNPVMDLGFKDSIRKFNDVNGDGRADFCREVGSRPKSIISCSISVKGVKDGEELVGLDGAIHYKGDLGYKGRIRTFADVTGDGRADYCRETGNDPKTNIACVPLPLATGLASGKDIIYRGDLGFRDGIRSFADINGDGKADYCRETGKRPLANNIACTLSTGSGFGNEITVNGDLGFSDGIRIFADVNGDGKADYCRETGNRPRSNIACKLSTGNSFNNEVVMTGDLGYQDGMRTFADVNGDGKADYCRETGNRPRSNIACKLSTGNSFGKDMVFRGDLGYKDGIRFFADVDGDGADDYVREVNTRPYSFHSAYSFRKNKHLKILPLEPERIY